jgi:ubiquinone/menaquinone biosynthesis C-methylase UbiE
MSTFKDHFSTQSSDYSKYRPDYPQELYDFILAGAREKKSAWDCGTGNGQAAAVLSHYLEKVFATDPSAEQIKNATQKSNIEYRVASAEYSNLPASSVDLITVAQALHWFDFDKFFTEVRRVAKPDAIIAVWSYELCKIDKEIDKVFLHFYNDILGNYWAPERKYVENAYSTIPFPFTEVKENVFYMKKQWNLQDFMGYLSTWSAVQKYIKINGTNPLELVAADFEKAWINPAAVKEISFPVTVKIGRV